MLPGRRQGLLTGKWERRASRCQSPKTLTLQPSLKSSFLPPDYGLSSGWEENGCRRAGAHEPLEAQNKKALHTAASLRNFPQDSHASCAWTCCCCLACLPILAARLPRSTAALSTATRSQPSLSHGPAHPSAEHIASSGASLRSGDLGHVSPFAGSLALQMWIQSCSNTLPLLYTTSTW